MLAAYIAATVLGGTLLIGSLLTGHHGGVHEFDHAGHDTDLIVQHLQTNRTLGVPYTDEEIADARADVALQANPQGDTDAFMKRYPKAVIVPGNGTAPTELDALVAYLQVLGTMVDFADVNTEKLQQ